VKKQKHETPVISQDGEKDGDKEVHLITPKKKKIKIHDVIGGDKAKILKKVRRGLDK